MLGKASWFRPEYGKLAAKLAGKPSQDFINWDMVVNFVSHSNRANPK
jgi:hypothetical protein